MDQDALDRLLESERFTLRHAAAALRWAAVESFDEATLAEHRQRLAFLVELLHRHALRMAGLACQNAAQHFAVEWQGAGYSPPRLDDPELFRALHAALEAARRGEAAALAPERLEPLLERVELGLDGEQAAWEASRALAAG